MASKDFAILDMQSDEDDEINLQFQDFGTSSTSQKGTKDKEQTVYFSNFPDSADDPEEQLIQNNQEQTSGSYSFWTFEYYQQYFNVDSAQVGDRIAWSMVPKPGVDYLQTYIRPNPDLYGPFWICLTLVFSTAIMGNVSNYLQYQDPNHWTYDFHKVSLAASSVFSYALIVPVMLWGIVMWRGSGANLKLLELICIYGYSLSIFVPVSILWIIPIASLQWCIGIVATVLSGGVLVRTILPVLSNDSRKVAIAVSTFVLVLHAVLAISFMLYFFSVPASTTPSVATSLAPGINPTVLPSLNASIEKIPEPSAMTKRNNVLEQANPNLANQQPPEEDKPKASIPVGPPDSPVKPSDDTKPSDKRPKISSQKFEVKSDRKR